MTSQQPPQYHSTHRIIAVPIIFDDWGRILVCKKPRDKGVFPGQWGLPGGGVEPGESLDQAVRREAREEVGIELSSVQPLFSKEGREPKYLGPGEFIMVDMVYHLFRCTAATTDVSLNEEFVDHAWATPANLAAYDLNDETRTTFNKLGII